MRMTYAALMCCLALALHSAYGSSFDACCRRITTPFTRGTSPKLTTTTTTTPEPTTTTTTTTPEPTTTTTTTTPKPTTTTTTTPEPTTTTTTTTPEPTTTTTTTTPKPTTTTTTTPEPTTTTTTTTPEPTTTTTTTTTPKPTTTTTTTPEPTTTTTTTTPKPTTTTTTTPEPTTTTTTTTPKPTTTTTTTTTTPAPTTTTKTTTTTTTTTTPKPTTTTVKPPDWTVCNVIGDPHYRTFDVAKISYQGICKLVLARPCYVEDQPQYFEIYAKNVNRFNVTSVSYPLYVEIFYKGATIRFRTSTASSKISNSDVFVNGNLVQVPYNDVNFKILYNSYYVRFDAVDAGFKVDFYGDRAITVTLPGKYYNKMCGLCGNNDIVDSNDLRLKNGTVVDSSELSGNYIGDSWVVPDAEVTDPKKCPAPPPPPPCKNTTYETRCGNMNNPSGPFGDCVRRLPPGIVKSYYEDCVLDACNSKGNTICTASVPAFLAECAAAGVPYSCDKWMTPFSCAGPAMCPAGMVYKCSVSPCQPTCAFPNAASNCDLPVSDSCVCPAGQLLHNGVCVLATNCPKGCLDPYGQLLPFGSSWAGPSCTTLTCGKCTKCAYGGQVKSSSDCTGKQTCINGACDPAGPACTSDPDPTADLPPVDGDRPNTNPDDVSDFAEVIRGMFAPVKFDFTSKASGLNFIKQAFKIMNRCGRNNVKDSFLDADELQRAMNKRTKFNFTIDEVVGLMTPGDADGDGRLSLSEFSDCMTA